MSLSTWVREQIEARARHHRLVWVHDPYALLEADEISVLQQDLKTTGHSLLVVKNALQLREGLEGRDPLTTKVALLDPSYTLRDAHLLPKDAQPADLLPLRAPDWKPLVDAEACFKPTVRGFLCNLTGDEQWPAAVNVFPYEKLARDDPHRFTLAGTGQERMNLLLTEQQGDPADVLPLFRPDPPFTGTSAKKPETLKSAEDGSKGRAAAGKSSKRRGHGPGSGGSRIFLAPER